MRHKIFIILLVIFILFLSVFIIFILIGKSPQSNPGPYQQPFHVIKTSPTNGEKNVFPALEKRISFTTDVPLIASSSFSLKFSPPLAKFTVGSTAYPTKEITTIGALGINTTYTVTLFNQKQEPIYSWSFSTLNWKR